jgi:hypothetical protein
MATNESPRRIVAWSDGCAHAEHTVAWAAKHAAERSLPLHIVQFSAAVTLTGPGDGPMHCGFAERDPAAIDVVRVAHEIQRIHFAHQQLPVTFEVLHEMSGRRIADTCDEHDVLVTDSAGFLRLAGEDAVSVPVVVVPEQDESVTADHGVLLLTGPGLSPAVGRFAFRAAVDLGTGVDLVRMMPQAPAFGDDYWIEPGSSAYLDEPRWQEESARWRTRFPGVPAASWVLRTRPAATLEPMARAARLAVVGMSSHRELNALLDLDGCPVAVVPES